MCRPFELPIGSKGLIFRTVQVYLKEYELDKVKPDIIITEGDYIVAIIELKFSPWGFPKYKNDIEKLNRLRNVNPNKLIQLGIKPFSSNWNVQKAQSNFLEFRLLSNFLGVFAVVGHPEANALNLDGKLKIDRLLHLIGFIKNKNEVFFGQKDYKK